MHNKSDLLSAMYQGSPLVNKIISILTWSSLILLVPLATLGFLSEQSIPGNPLYPVKRTIENIVTGFESFNKNALALYQVSLVAQRFSETKKLASDNSIALNTAQVQDFIAQINSARDTINTVTDPQEKQTLRQQLLQQIANYKNELVILQTQQTGTTNITSEPNTILLPSPSPQLASIQPVNNESNSLTQVQNLINQLQQEQSQIQQDQNTNSPNTNPSDTPSLTPGITTSETPTSGVTLNQNQPTETSAPTQYPTQGSSNPTNTPNPTNGTTPIAQPPTPTAAPTIQPTQQPNSSSPTPFSGHTGQSNGAIVATDTFHRQNQTEWGTASDGQIWNGDVNTNSNFFINNHMGEIGYVNATPPYGVTLHGTLGPQMLNGQVLLTGGTNAFDTTSLYNGFGAVLRYTDENNFYRGYITGSNLVITKKVQGTLTFLSEVPFTANNFQPYAIRFQIIGSSLSIKAWQIKNSEPSNWAANVTDTSLTGPGYSGVRITLDSSNQVFAYLSFQATQY